jgi:regulator of cell morphogenesis and NO signaling
MEITQKLNAAQISPSDTIADMVTKHPNRAKVFRELGIDFSCRGNMTIREACEQKGLDIEDVLLHFKNTSATDTQGGLDFVKWDSSFLSQYIVQMHHKYVKTLTTYIKELSRKVAIENSLKHPEITRVADIFTIIGKTLVQNTDQEELVLFPYIHALSEAYKKDKRIKAAEFDNLSIPLTMIQAEHQQLVKDFEEIRLLTNNYELPRYVSSSYTILLKMLRDYEDDLIMHVHIENNILFPKLLALEDEMRTNGLLA